MYFRQFPKIPYSFDLSNQGTIAAVTNIFARFSINSSIVNNSVAFYKYQVEDNDTPELIAYKQYGDPQLHWVILMINKINDPLFELPLSRDALERKIVKQYGYSSISEAYSSIHHYELEVTRKLIEVDGATTETTNTSIVTLNQYNYTSNTIQVKGLGSQNSEIIGPVNFYANNSDNTSAVVATLTMTSTYNPVYVYNYENELNESKRLINILKPEYVEPLVDEIERILNA
jgi:hypothetical protein